MTATNLNLWILEGDTNAPYDLYHRLTLSQSNAWARLAELPPGGTNFFVEREGSGFFLLGTWLDADADGLPDAFEDVVTGTSPTAYDTDGDGLSDADEDRNGDGTPNHAEYQAGIRASLWASRPTAAEGGPYGEFTLSLPWPAPTNGTPLSLHVGGNAEAGFHYALQPQNGSLSNGVWSLPAGTAVARLRISPSNDVWQAAQPRYVTLQLLSSPTYPVDNRLAAVWLLDDDLPTVAVKALDAEAAEPVGSSTNVAVFQFERIGRNTNTLAATFTLGGSATPGTDYETVSTNISFAAGTNLFLLTLRPRHDTNAELAETVSLTLRTNAAYRIDPARSSATATIYDDDLPLVQVVAADSDAREAGPKAGRVTFTRTGVTNQPLVIRLAAGGSARPGADYHDLPGEVVIPAGTNAFSLNINPLPDAELEGMETVIITLLGSHAYHRGVSNVATIHLDDSHPTTYGWRLVKATAVFRPSPPLNSPGVVEVYRLGSSRAAASFPYQTLSNYVSVPISRYLITGDVSAGQVLFPANAATARVNISANLGEPNMNLMISNLFGPFVQPVHFLAPHLAVSLSVVDDAAVENVAADKAVLRLSRGATGPALSVPVQFSGRALPVVDHDLATTVNVIFATNQTQVDLPLTGLFDALLEGWESVVARLNPLAANYSPVAPWHRTAFIRENVSLPALLPQSDADLDFLPDRWEAEHGLDPATPDDAQLDPDNDGLTTAEEAAYNLDPLNADTDGDGLNDFAETAPRPDDPEEIPVGLRIGNYGKTLLPGQQCATCHILRLHVGDEVSAFAAGIGGDLVVTNTFRRGQSYPLRFTEFFRDHPNLTGSLTAPTVNSAKYNAALFAPEGAAGFFVDDPSSRLGTNKVWSDALVATTNAFGTLIVPRLDLAFTNLSGHLPTGTNPNWAGGVRVFPDQLSPTDSAARNKVRVLVSTTPPMPGKQVRLRALDVDDPTPYSEDEGFVVDANDNVNGGEPRGGDNRGAPAAGTLAATLLTLDGQGRAQTDLTLPMQPGDNLRVAAVFEQPGATNHLNALQVTNPAAPLYVAADNAALRRFRGGLSPLLTVWRRLNVEVDSMQMWTGSKPAPDRTLPTGMTWTRDSGGLPRSVLSLKQTLPAEAEFFASGKMKQGSVVLDVADNSQRSLVVNDRRTGPNTYAPPSPAELAAFTNVTFELFDDDGAGLPAGTTILPRTDLVSPNLNGYFKNAYIFVTNVPSNPRSLLPFEINTSIGLIAPSLDDMQDFPSADRPAYWYHLLVAAYQPSANSDGDPLEGGVLLGGTLEPVVLLRPFSVVFVETVRERAFVELVGSQAAAVYQTWIDATVAHEIAHAPGERDEGSDHAEGGLMAPGTEYTPRDAFTGKTIIRLRSANKWYE